eukprot:scaffold101969_cov40-Phaeocystis_antarctica.AAC.1
MEAEACSRGTPRQAEHRARKASGHGEDMLDCRPGGMRVIYSLRFAVLTYLSFSHCGVRGDREVSGSSVCEGVCEAPTFTE